MSLFRKQRLGIDLGTNNTLIYIDNKGIALREPSIVAVNRETQEPIAFGKEAEKLLGKTSEQYEIVRPMREGVIASFSLTKMMLAHFIKKAIHHSFSSPEVVICVPINITKVERRAVIDAVKDVGIRKALIVEDAFAAALGAKLPIQEPHGKMIVDIGGGTTNIAVLSFGEIIESKSVVYASNKMSEAIVDFVKKEKQLNISLEEAEILKIKIGNASYTSADQADYYRVKGRNVITGLPEEKEIRAELVANAIEGIIKLLIQSIKQVLEITPPELSVDLLESGIYLTGGGALLKRLPERIQKELSVPVHLVEVPLDVVAIGAGKLLREMELQARIVEKQRR